jgi:hypothetical protein
MAVGPIGGITPVILAAIKSINGDVFMTVVPWLAVCAGVSLISTAVLIVKFPATNRDPKRAKWHWQRLWGVPKQRPCSRLNELKPGAKSQPSPGTEALSRVPAG